MGKIDRTGRQDRQKSKKDSESRRRESRVKSRKDCWKGRESREYPWIRKRNIDEENVDKKRVEEWLINKRSG